MGSLSPPPLGWSALVTIVFVLACAIISIVHDPDPKPVPEPPAMLE